MSLQMHGGELLSGVNAISNGDGVMQNEVDSRKLVILGLPWDTTEGSLEQHFSQIGPLQVRTAHIGLLSRRGPSLYMWARGKPCNQFKR